MSFESSKRLTEITVVPLTDLADAELERYATEVHLMVKDNCERLGDLLLHGVVERHSVSAKESLRVARENRNDMFAGNIGAYAVCAQDSTKISTIGSATLMPNLPLRRQRLPIPPPIARKLPGEYASREVPDVGTNAVAWVDLRRDDWRRETSAAQSALIQEAQGAKSLWRIIPTDEAIRHDWDEIMGGAGYGRDRKDTKGKLYDDREVRFGKLLPPSFFYQAVVLEAA